MSPILSKALSIDGATQYVSINHNAILNIQSALTMLQWFYITEETWDWAIMGGKGDAYKLGLLPELIPFGSVYVGSEQKAVMSDTPLAKNTWHMTMLTFDGRYVKLYVNNVLKATNDLGAPGNLIDTTVRKLFLGADNDGADNPAYMFKGYIEEHQFYNKELSEAERNAAWAAGAGRYGQPTDDGLVVGYHQNNNPNDYSVNALHGTNIGSPSYVNGHIYYEEEESLILAVSGVLRVNIKKVSGVAIADINKISGVPNK